MPAHRSILLALATASLIGSDGPPRRAHHALIYDPSRQRVILTGGSSPLDSGRRFAMFDDRWEFDGVRWSARASSGAAMSGMTLAWDARRARVVSFGGYMETSIGEVRELGENGWRTTGAHPSLLAAEPGFVYDSAHGRFITFGGSSGPGHVNGETWELDGDAWTRRDIASPSGRQGHVMVHDVSRGRTLVFGGMAQSPAGQRPPILGDAWEYDGRVWTRVEVSGPSPRTGAGATYDSRRHRIIVFGGLAPSGFVGDTWAWDGRAWTKLADGPAVRAMGYLAYDVARDRVVLFGGRKGWPDGDLNDTWEFNGKTWREIR